VKLCRRLHIARSSTRTYAASQRVFLQFCEDFNVDPWCITEDDLSLAVVFFAMNHTCRSVPSYLSAIQNLWTTEGLGPLPRGVALKHTVKGLIRILGSADVVIRTKALLVEELKCIIDSLDATNPTDIVFACECITAFFLCLRTEDHVAVRLRWGDIYVQADGSVEFVLPPGKRVRYFRHVALAARSDSLDLLTWLIRLCALVPSRYRSPQSPVFISFTPDSRGRLHYHSITRRAFIQRFKVLVEEVLGFSPTLYAGYSLRRGGVTELLKNCGGHLPMVKRHVGWSKDSNAVYDYYSHEGKAQLLRPTLGMGVLV
jgi:hypothetical protein